MWHISHEKGLCRAHLAYVGALTVAHEGMHFMDHWNSSGSQGRYRKAARLRHSRKRDSANIAGSHCPTVLEEKAVECLFV